jgi:hypothetical protein
LVSDSEYLTYLEPRLVELLGLIQRYKDANQNGEALKQSSEALKRYSESIAQLNKTEKKKRRLEHLLNVVSSNKSMIISERRLDDGNYEVEIGDPLALD